MNWKVVIVIFLGAVAYSLASSLLNSTIGPIRWLPVSALLFLYALAAGWVAHSAGAATGGGNHPTGIETRVVPKFGLRAFLRLVGVQLLAIGTLFAIAVWVGFVAQPRVGTGTSVSPAFDVAYQRLAILLLLFTTAVQTVGLFLVWRFQAWACREFRPLLRRYANTIIIALVGVNALTVAVQPPVSKRVSGLVVVVVASLVLSWATYRYRVYRGAMGLALKKCGVERLSYWLFIKRWKSEPGRRAMRPMKRVVTSGAFGTASILCYGFGASAGPVEITQKVAIAAPAASISIPMTVPVTAAPNPLVVAPAFTAGSTSDTFDGLCGQGPTVQPGYGAPSWAVTQLHDLWLGAGSGVGANVAGCPLKAEIVSDSSDVVSYQVGMLSGSIVSVGVASRAHGAAIFLGGGIANYILGLLQSGYAVSGSARVDVGNGDMQLLWSRLGTIALVRSTKHVTNDPSLVSPYIALPPGATVEWLSALRKTGNWLWPTSPTRVGDKFSVGLSVLPEGSAIGTISWTTQGRATLSMQGSTENQAANGSILQPSDFTIYLDS